MANMTVKGVNALFDVSVSAKASLQSENNTESFDKTLNSIRTEKNQKDNEFEGIDSSKSESKDVERYDATGRKNQVKPEEEITDEQMAAVSEEVICQIKELLMDKYNISEEQLGATIEGLGLNEESLLNVTELTQVVMKLEGIENQADMLTNPDFAKNIKDILSKLEDIKANVNVEDFQVESQDIPVETKPVEVEKTTESVESVIVGNATDTTTGTETTTTTVEKTDVVEEVVASEPVENTNATPENDNFNGSLKRDDKQSDVVRVKDASTKDNANLTVQPQDFVQRLTEDLSSKVGETQATDIVRQVVEQTQLQVKQGVTSLEMQLYPEHLGKVLVQVVSNEGTITAQITAESEAAKTALESQLTLLKENLNNQGVKVENVEVTIASHAFEQNMQGEAKGEQNSSQSKRSRRNADMFFDDINDETVDEVDKGIMELKGSTVSYTA